MTQFATSGQLGADFSAVFTPSTNGWPIPSNGSPFAVGQVVEGTSGSRYVYVLAGEAILQYMAVSIDADYAATKLTKALADTLKPVGFAQAAIPSGSSGWVCVAGEGISILAKGGSGDFVAMYTTTSAGVLSGTSTSQTLIAGVVLSSSVAPGASTATAAIATYPRAVT